MQELYDSLLSLSGLSRGQIRELDLDGLRDALGRINAAIANPDQYPRVELSAKSGRVVAVLSDKEGPGLIGALPVLLDRKRMILERIKELHGEEKITGIRELIDRLPDGDDKEALNERLDALERVASESDTLTREAALEQSALQANRDREIALLKMELEERKWALRSTHLFAREPVATLVGAALLVILAVTIIVAMFTKIEVSTLLSNSFLIILGYFFGQSAERRSGRENPGSEGK
ncbi:hypothetical protein [Streptomyces sp. NPDC001820]|uniref:hypothetical protein n=1 Tax=Streptomyces sp. NPDC001820 TaxID=3364613 RepID=UPI00369B721F